MSEQFSSYDVARLNFNASGTTITDALGHAFTCAGGATQNSTFVKYGTNALTCSGINNKVSSPNHADWNMGSGNFGIDFFIAFNNLTLNQNLFDIGDSNNAAINISSCFLPGGKGGIKVVVQLQNGNKISLISMPSILNALATTRYEDR